MHVYFMDMEDYARRNLILFKSNFAAQAWSGYLKTNADPKATSLLPLVGLESRASVRRNCSHCSIIVVVVVVCIDPMLARGFLMRERQSDPSEYFAFAWVSDVSLLPLAKEDKRARVRADRESRMYVGFQSKRIEK